MNEAKSKVVEEALAKRHLHDQWESLYRSSKNEKFFEQVFDYITRALNAPKNSTFLDVGCGSCGHAIHLANRGFFVQAADFSESVLKKAEAKVKAKGLETKISIQREDVLALSFEDKSFNYVLCWGVLMHIPDLEKAIAELTRVLKPGGTLVIGEGNMYSLQSIILRNIKRFIGKKKAIAKKTQAGIESWCTTPAGMLLVRHSNIGWLIERFKSNRFIIKKRMAGQFTEAYTKVSSQLLRSFIHSFNMFWFRYIKIPHPAFGNILILQKED